MAQIISVTTPPDGINAALLDSELAAAHATDYEGLITGGTLRVVLADNAVTTQADVQSTVDAHDATQRTEQQRRDAAQSLTRDDIMSALRDAMASDNPDYTAIYNQALNLAQQNALVLNTVQNMVRLYELQTGTSVNTTTNAGKATYLRAFIHMVALWS